MFDCWVNGLPLFSSRESVVLRRLSTPSSKRQRRNTNDTQYRGVRGANPEQVWTASPQRPCKDIVRIA
ncbi:MAG TPA: hypothetical protein DCE42_07895 [Myxococcales bacterium]|nr:hypothetical protein [Deltaproteobacteria bacterium]MBU50714.1 hypothetical protein [Deltaproteobacteria bacterium]HAA54665.1 hypothetical protein [Myxococcales bacterium]